MIVRLLLRDMDDYFFKSMLHEFGRRGAFHKSYAEVNDTNNQSYIFCSIQANEDFVQIFKTENKKKQIKSILCNTITHPFINNPCFSEFRDNKLVSIRQLFPMGSIKDKIYNKYLISAKNKSDAIKQSYVDKYETVIGTPLSKENIAYYGRQILEALYYLYLHYFPFPHLHPGNVYIGENDIVQLTDLENTLTGLEPYYIKSIHSFISKGFKIQPEVVCFGNLLFEMAMGYPKVDCDIQSIQNKCDSAIFDILKSIFEPDDKENVPTIKSLLRNKFFKDVQLLITVHDIVLKEKWDDEDTTLLKQVRSLTNKVLTPIVRQVSKKSLRKSQLIDKDVRKSQKMTLSDAKTNDNQLKSLTSNKNVPPPPPPPPSSNVAPPPPPPPTSISNNQKVTPKVDLPQRPDTFNNLLEAIRNSSIKNLKKVKKDD